MTGNKRFITILGVTLIGFIVFALVSAFTNSRLPTTETLPIVIYEEQGLITDPGDNTKCIVVTASTTSTNTPPVPAPVVTPKPSSSSKFESLVTLASKQTITLGDGLTITLLTINDSRCAPDVQCIWAGELAPQFSVTGGFFGTKVETVSLGTARTTATTIGGYTFTLVTATKSTATIKVSKKPVAQNNGTVSGTVTIGPICPVERVDEPCEVPPETYTSRKIIVYEPTDSAKN